MPAAASGTMLGWREQASTRRGCLRAHVVQVRVGEAVQWGAGSTRARQASVAGTALAYRIRQGDQVILVRVGGLRKEGPGVAHEFPSAGRSDAAAMAHA
jgi:hypothetical protein